MDRLIGELLKKYALENDFDVSNGRIFKGGFFIEKFNRYRSGKSFIELSFCELDISSSKNLDSKSFTDKIIEKDATDEEVNTLVKEFFSDILLCKEFQFTLRAKKIDNIIKNV